MEYRAPSLQSGMIPRTAFISSPIKKVGEGPLKAMKKFTSGVISKRFNQKDRKLSMKSKLQRRRGVEREEFFVIKRGFIYGLKNHFVR